MIRNFWFAALIVLGAEVALSERALRQADAQSRPAAEAKPAAPVPLLPAEGFDDGHGYAVPGAEWKHVTPESEGFSSARLEALRALVKTHQTDAMMIASRGKVVFEYGDTTLVSKVASVRKSALDLMFAVEVQHGLKLDDVMNETVVELGLEEKRTPFLPIEQHATLEQLMMSRSGIYIASGNADQAKVIPRAGPTIRGLTGSTTIGTSTRRGLLSRRSLTRTCSTRCETT